MATKRSTARTAPKQRYIVQPIELSVEPPIDRGRRRFGGMRPEERRKQIEEVVSLHAADPIQREIREWVDQARGVEALTKGPRATPVTGTVVVEMSPEEAEQMRKDLPGVAVVPDRPLELIPPRRGAATATAKVTKADLWHLKAIGVEAARKRGFGLSGKGVSVAVLDTGISPHPELDGRVDAAFTFDVQAWRPERQDPSHDTQGHGTHVAGLICGKTIGVAPDARLLSGVMIPGGRGTTADFILALEWAALQPQVQLVSMSAGIRGYLPDLHRAVGNLLEVGVLPVVAVGNEGRNQTRSPGNYAEVLSVGATDAGNGIASFSSSGTILADHHLYTVPDVVAPGKGVFSCVREGGYEAWDGTSMSAPIVAGLAALFLQRHPDITVLDLVEEILGRCKMIEGDPVRQGHGLVRVGASR
jgi:subtilisin family serine protease